MLRIWRLALPRIIAIIFLQLGVILAISGVMDFSRGQAILPMSVPICEGSCNSPLDNATRIVLDATIGHRSALEEIEPTGSLCRFPATILESTDPNSDFELFLDALAVEGIVEVEMDRDSWLVYSGYNTTGYLSAVKKLFAPSLAQKSCFEPMTVWYGPLALVLLTIGLMLLISAPSRYV